MGTLLGVANSAGSSKALGIEDKIMKFAEKARANGWGCEDPAEQPEKTGQDIATFVAKQGIPQRIISTLTGEHLSTPAYQAVEKFLGAPREGWCLVLAGPKGCGKSTAAAYYLWEKARQSEGNPSSAMRWWTASRVARVSGYNQELEKMMQVSHMVIDDLGTEYLDKNGYFSHRLDELIDDRYSNYKRTIITTNLNAKDFQNRYGDRVADRIREGFKHGGGYAELDGKSLRA